MHSVPLVPSSPRPLHVAHGAQAGTAARGFAARGASASRERQRTRHALVVVQVALAVVLLVGSGLMIRTFQALLNVDAGFAGTDDVQTARVWVPPQSVTNLARVTRFQPPVNTSDLAARVEPVPLPITGFAQAEYRRQFDLMPDGRQFLMLFPIRP